MKTSRFELRIEPSLKKSFESAARFNHQTLSQFLVQAGRAAVNVARGNGLTIKEPPTPRDGRRKAVAT
jgi:hypothetical protein